MDTQDALHDAHVARLETNRLEHVLVQWLDEPGDTRTDEFLAAWETHEKIGQCKAETQRLEQKLASLRAKSAWLLGQLAGATQEYSEGD